MSDERESKSAKKKKKKGNSASLTSAKHGDWV